MGLLRISLGDFFLVFIVLYFIDKYIRILCIFLCNYVFNGVDDH